MRRLFPLIAIVSSLSACASAPSNADANPAYDGDYTTGSNIPRRAKKAPSDHVQTYDGTTPGTIPLR